MNDTEHIEETVEATDEIADQIADQIIIETPSTNGNHTPGEEPDTDKLMGVVEALLFSTPNPLASKKIADAAGHVGIPAVKKAIAALNEKYESGDHAFRIRQIGGGYQYFVVSEFTEAVKQLFARERKLRLTKAALETLAIVAYKQPVSKNQIEYIRGVACDGVISNLLEKNLIKLSGRSEGVGRSLLYSATDEFLKFFGLNKFEDLPKIAEIEELIGQMESERLSDNAELALEDAADSPPDYESVEFGEAPEVYTDKVDTDGQATDEESEADIEYFTEDNV